jgi:hypothetical protein
MTSGVSAALTLGVAFFLDFADFGAAESLAAFGVEVPLMVLGVFNLIVVLGFLTESGRGSVCRSKLALSSPPEEETTHILIYTLAITVLLRLTRLRIL